MNLTDRTIIITGASGGIGGALARTLTEHGARVMLTARTESKLQALRDELTDAGAQATYHPGDVTIEANCRAIVQATLDTFGGVDVLVNNAGYGPAAPLVETTEDLWDVTLNACLKSAYLMSRAVMPTLLANTDGGAVVNISSIAGKRGFSGGTAYCAAKWGMQGFTEALRAELGDRGIRAYTVCPAAVATPWWGNTNSEQPDEVMQRMILPEEVADAVRYLLMQPERIQVDEIVIENRHDPFEMG